MRKLIEANRIDLATLTVAAQAADAGDGGPARRRHRRARVRVGARVADGADAAADARHRAVRLRAGRRLFAALSVPEPGDAAARRRRPGQPTCRRTTCAWSRRPRRWSRATTRTRRCCSSSCRRRSRSTAAPAGSSTRATSRSAGDTEQPLAKEAQRFYANGVPVLQRYLPFWLANLIDRMWVVLVSIIAILIPLSRALPPLYQFRIRSRIFRWYAQLRDVEDAMGKQPHDELLARARRDRAARRARDGAAELRRRAVFAAQPHPDGARAIDEPSVSSGLIRTAGREPLTAGPREGFNGQRDVSHARRPHALRRINPSLGGRSLLKWRRHHAATWVTGCNWS